MSVGSADNVTLRLTDPYVSRYHIEVEGTDDGVLIRDLGSRNGSRVSALTVREVLSRGEVEVELGRTRVRVTPGDGRVELPLSAAGGFGKLVGASRAMREVYVALERAAPTSVPVLITGESGTGKELVARAVHYASASREHAFMAVNCTAFPRDLLESELFGHARGAFTGAVGEKLGRFQIAGGGTLFLDEIGELPMEIQTKLLRVVQERVFERVGDPRPIPLKARIITATHRDLAQMVREGTFREDLYYRLRVVEVHLPPLRERRDDLPVLVEHLLSKITRDQHKRIRYVAREALDLIAAYPWPGNVRELENALTRAVVLTKGEVLEAGSLPIQVEEYDDGGEVEAPDEGAPDGLVSLREVEQRHIAAVLAATGWNKRRSGQILGITRQTLDRKIRDYRLERPPPSPPRGP